MFGSMKKQLEGTNRNDIETIIGANTIIKGEINGSSNLRVDGTVEGSITVSGNVLIGENGRVKGDIVAPELMVSGQVEGNATIETGSLVGDVKVGSLKIEDGGVFKGHSEMTFKAAEPVFAD